ncbi:hypothetical protein ASD77_08385 [Pseudoxanthomonas sp. Root65]|uniref:prealbumin-like fold domain-containing protein n=1 Tax=Pseudoxanthomonas sp. Root65 TaxID=1736576 RepID=UPI0006F47AAB|nr:DUF11 domain-containing protein [Pseudoxanthomonas sp. Root65]KRA54594.1 hypothetical protein ASD77_08385 [Pseudoxanthomonas sp. Root65]
MKTCTVRQGMAAAVMGVLLLVGATARAQTCPTGSTNPLAPYDNQGPSQTIINANNVYVGNSRLQVTHAVVGGAAGILNTNIIDNDHIDADVGVRIGHNGNADSATRYILSTYSFRSPDLAQALPVSNLTFRIHDLDAGDNVTVNAYDQSGGLIAITTSMYSFNPGGTIITRVSGTNRFSSPNTNVDDLRGTVYLDFSGLQISRVELVYYDVNATGTYTVADLKACNPTLTLRKTTQLLAGGPFGFTLTNTSRNTGATVTTSAANAPEQVDGNAGTTGVQVFGITAPNTAVTINETGLPTGWMLVPAATTCTNAGGATIGTLSGTTYTIPGGATGHTFPGAAITCTYTNIAPRSEVQVTKTVAPSPVVTGQVATYTIVVRNNGPQAVSNAVLADVAGAGQNCSVPSTTATCVAAGGATCPASLPVATLLAGGVTIPSLPLNGQVIVTLQCTVTATGF